MKKLRVAALALALAAQAAGAQPPKLAITLAQAEEESLAHSPILKAAQSSLAAAQAQVDAQLAQLVPSVTLEGSYQYQTIVPNIAFLPGAPAFQFGSHDTYSVGPAVSYTLWDQGSLLNAWRSQKALASSQKAQQDLVRRQVLLVTRLDYFQVQLALEQERSLADSLKLTQAQDRDIGSRFRAGAASRIDRLSAHDQVINRLRDFRSAQAQTAAALRVLFAQMGRDQSLDVSAPMDARITGLALGGLQSPSVIVKLEPLEAVEAKFESAAGSSIDAAYPGLMVYAEEARAQELSAKSLSARDWPRLAFIYKSEYMYPNLPLLQTVWQNEAGFGLSLPIFDYGLNRSQARTQQSLAGASLAQENEASDQLLRDWHKAQDHYAALKNIETLDRQAVDETGQIARLRYASYKIGGSTILDVETANIDAIEALIAAAQTKTQALIELATLESLSSGKENL